MKEKPCEKCPWVRKIDPNGEALKEAARPSLERGEWFCCHVNMGKCHGAAALQRRMGLKETAEAD